MSLKNNILNLKLIFKDDWFKSFFNTSAIRFINLFLGILSSIFVARHLGPEARGHLAFLMSVSLTLAQFCTFGIPSLSTYIVSKNKQHLKKHVANSLVILLFITILCALFLLCIFPFIYTSAFSEKILILAFVLFNLAGLFFSSSLLGLVKISLWNKLELLKSITYVLICFFVIALGVKDPVYFFVASLFSVSVHAIVAFKSLFNFKDFFDILRVKDFAFLKNSAPFLVKNHIATFLGYFLTRVNFLVIPFYLNDKILGLYAIAYSFIENFLIFSSSLNTIMYPKICQIEESEQRKEMTLKILKIFFLFSTLFVVVIYFIIDFIVVLMYGVEYKESSQMVIYLLPSFLFLSMVSTISNFVASQNMHRVVVYAPLIAVTVFAIIFWPAVKSFGVNGLIWSMNLSYFIYLCVYMVFMMRPVKKVVLAHE